MNRNSQQPPRGFNAGRCLHCCTHSPHTLNSLAVPTDPHAIFDIWTALKCELPIVTVVIPGAYNFAHAAAAFADLPQALKTSHRGSTESPKTAKATNLEVLRSWLPTTVDVAALGRRIDER